MYGNYYTVSFSEKQEPGGGGEGGYMGFFEKYPNLYDYFTLLIQNKNDLLLTLIATEI